MPGRAPSLGRRRVLGALAPGGVRGRGRLAPPAARLLGLAVGRLAGSIRGRRGGAGRRRDRRRDRLRGRGGAPPDRYGGPAALSRGGDPRRGWSGRRALDGGQSMGGRRNSRASSAGGAYG